MSIEQQLSLPIRGIEAFNELPIDAAIWNEAHGHPRRHQELHDSVVHRPGIVSGLEVYAGSAERTVVVAPGFGIDPKGRVLRLPEPISIALEERGQVYITLQHLHTYDARSGVLVGGGTKYYRFVEGHKVEKSRELPTEPYLELARIDRSNANSAISEPTTPFDPGSNELNFLYRTLAFPHCYADGSIGELVLLPRNDPSAWKPNRAGLWNMLRYGNGLGFHLDFSGPFNLKSTSASRLPLVLYSAGTDQFEPLSDGEIEGLQRYLDRGGFLFVEAATDSNAFEQSAMAMLSRVGAKLKDVTAPHPLLTSHQVFAAPPAGGRDRGVLRADLDRGVVYSSFNYGGAWQGTLTGSTSRDQIRGAQEFGLNIVAAAARRRRKIELN